MNLVETFALAGFSVTVLLALLGGIDWLIRKWLQRHRDELVVALNNRIAELHQENQTRTNDRDLARADLASTAQSLATTSLSLAESGKVQSELEEARSRIQHDEQARTSHETRIRRALELEGAIWTQKTMAGTPRFLPLAQRRTPIISVLNLKGGVGKTTVTAYLAQALAKRGYRVLLVDLDLQGSLSSLFVDVLQLSRESKGGGKFIQELIAPARGSKRADILECTRPVPLLGPHARIVPATDKLAYAELSQTVQWLLRVGDKSNSWNGRNDGRMILRRALHRPRVHRKFDVVLMDCPPLINLCCANALAASDYVLTPVTPSQKSIERVAPLVRRIKEVRSSVNEDLQMLGYVVNNTRQKDGLTAQESDLFQLLPQQCREVQGTDVYQFDTTIPGRIGVRAREQNFTGAEEDPVIIDAFERLAEELIKRLPGVCRHPDERRAARRKVAREVVS